MKTNFIFLRKIKKLIVFITGIWFYKVKKLPVGTHLFYFLKFRTSNDFKIIFDVGSNIGQTIFEIRKYFPKSVIHCFEPFSSTFNKLTLNTSSFQNIIYNNLALGDKIQNLTVEIIDDTSVSNSLKNHYIDNNKAELKVKVDNIKCTTLDHYLHTRPDVDFIDLLKIDTEGYDKKVLEGGEKYLFDGRVKFVITEVGLSKENTKHIHLNDMIEYMENLNFFYIGNFSVDIRHILWGGHIGNALFIHKNFLKLLNGIVK
jgi:FkbM family methyltransferase